MLMEVFFGLPPAIEETQHERRPLIQFLYELHQMFDLEQSATETFLFPRDELLLFKLVLREQCSVTEQDDPQLLWFNVCRKRLHCATSESEELCNLADKVDCLLKAFNMIDRTTILLRILNEFQDNLEMKNYVFDTNYLVYSNSLDWFEYLVLELMISYGIPNIRFQPAVHTIDPVGEKPFFQFRHCIPHFVTYYKKCTVTDVLLSYLGLSVNIKDSIRLLRLLNRPKRGLERETFAALCHLAKQSNLSAMQVAMSFATVSQLNGSQVTYTSLKPWAAGIYHLVDCLTKCQDALSGVSDELILVTTGSNDRMNLKDACSAVSQCLRSAGRLLKKPVIGAKSCPGDLDYDDTFNDVNIKQALDRLTKKLIDITSSTTLQQLCGETPGRSLSRGGSLRGRAATRLARFLLVVSEQRQDLSSAVTTQPHSNFTLTPVRSTLPKTPSTTHPSTTTPTTAGRGEQLLRMFFSPQTPFATEKATEDMKENLPETTILPLIPELDTEISLPERPLFSRYQSNLDWTDACYSPPPKRCTLSALNDWNSQSMPAWSERRTGSVPLFDKQASTKLSNASSPTKIVPSPDKQPRTLFTDPPAESQEIVTTKNPTSKPVLNKKSQQSKGPNARKKRLSEPKVDSKQRSLIEFFRA